MYRTRRRTRGSGTSVASENHANTRSDATAVTSSRVLPSSLPSSGPATPVLVASTRRGTGRAAATKNSNDSNALPAATNTRMTSPTSSEETTVIGQSTEVNKVVIANSTSQQAHQQHGNIGSKSSRTRRGSLSTTTQTQQLRRSERGAGAATTIAQVIASSQAGQPRDNANIIINNNLQHSTSGLTATTTAVDTMAACGGDKTVATASIINIPNTISSISNDETTQQRHAEIRNFFLATTVAASTAQVENVGDTSNCCIGFVENDGNNGNANILVPPENIGSVSVLDAALTKTTTSGVHATSTSIAILEIEKDILKGDIFKAKENTKEPKNELLTLPPILLVDGSTGLPLASSVENVSGDVKDTCGISDSSSVGSYEGESPKQSTFYVTVTDEGSVYFNPTTPDAPVIEEGETFSVNLPTHKIKSPTNPLPGLVSATASTRSRKTKPQAVTYGGETHVGFLDSTGQAVIKNGNLVTMEVEFGGHSATKNRIGSPAVVVSGPITQEHLIRPTNVSSSSTVVSLDVPATSIDVSEFESHLDPQSIAVLENVLQSDQGREILTEALGEMGVVPASASQEKQLWEHKYSSDSQLGQDEAVVSSSSSGIVCVDGSPREPTSSTMIITSCEGSQLTTGCRGHGKQPTIPTSVLASSNGERVSIPVSRKLSESESSCIRRSQRQQDRIERQEAERILAENQQMLQREKETMAKAATSCHTNISVTVTEPPINVGIVSTTQLVVTSPVSAAVLVPEVPGAIAVVEPATKLCTFSVEKMEDSGGRRPIRNRKLPAHLADPNYLSLEDATTAVKEATRRMSTTQEMIPPAEEITISQTEIKEEKQDETLYTTNDEYTDDDPNRLWCICKQPHNNRFMICCDRCEDWFHGKCVNVTKSQGKAMELKNIPWHCPDCKKTIATDKNVESQPQTVVPQKQGTKRKPILPETSLGTGRKSDDQLSPKSISAKTAKAAAAAAALKAEAEAAAFTALSAEPPSKIAAAAASKRGRRKSDKNEAEEFIATNCVICKKPARSGSVYCSDQCVQKYAQAVGSNSPTPDKSHAPASLTVSSPAIPLMEHTPATSTSTKSLMVATTSSKIKRSHSKSESAQDAIFNFHVINPGTSVSTEVVPQKPKEITASALFKAQKEKNVIVSGIVSAVTCPTTPQDVSSQPISLTPVPVVLPEKPEIIPNSVNVNAIMNSSSTDVKKKVDTSDGGSSKGRVMNTLAVVEKICIEEEVTLVSCIPDAKEKPERHITSLHSSDGKISRPSSSNTSTTTRRARTDSACKSKERERRDSQRDIKSDGPPSSEKLHRENMRKSLKEILKNRIDGMSVGHKNKMEAMGNSADTVSIKIEDELVMCYGGANSTKCKNKYRSIYFNLKDEKNSLFREILLGSIEPYDLVRMTPEQMAPSELAQWRQQEKEKELEAIKRAELDKLAEAKKQELLDKGVEDAVQVAEESKPLDISDVIDEDAGGKRLSSGDKDLSARDGKDRSSSHHRNHEKKELRTRDGKDKGRDHKSDIEKSRGKDKHRHENERDREKGRKSDRHSSKSRHKSFGSSEKKTHHSKDGECRSKERNSSRDKDKERRSDRHKYRDKNQKPSKVNHSSSGVHKELPHRHQSGKSESLKITDSFGSENSKNEEPESLGQTFDLIVPVSSSSCYNYTTQLSTSESRTSTVTTAFEVSTTVSTTNALSTSQAGLGHKSQVTVTESKPIVKEEERHSIESEQELPSSTIKTPDFTDDSNSGVKREEEEHVFQSTLLMPELGEFKASFYNVSHSEVLKGLCFPESPVPIVGRIGPQTVWDYIDKMKKTKEIITFRLTPSSPADAKGYMSFFTYLSSRERLGVIGGISHPLKDVYLIPLGKHQPVPRCLLPFRGPGLPKERTHCLLAVVTRHAPNDGSLKRKLSTTEPVAKKKTKGEPTKVNRNKGNKNAAIVTSKSPKIPSPAKSEIVTDKGDENEPYTPWDEDEKTDVVEDSAAPSTSLASISAPESGSVVLSETQKQLQEIEAQIAKQKEDIVSILAGAKNVVGIPGLDGDYPESVSTENADTTGEIEEIPVFLRTAPALSNLDPRSSRSNIFKYQLPAVKFSANVTSTISIPGLDLETKEAPDDDDVVVLDQNEDFINTPLLKPVLEANDSKKVRDSAEEAYSPSAMDFSDDEPVGHGTAESVSQVDTYDGNKMITPNRCFNPVSSDSLELDKIKTHSDFDSKHPISQSKESQIVDLDERQTEEIKIILKKISTPRISTSHINEKQVGLEHETSDGSPDLNDDSEPPPPGECHALPLRPLSASPLAKTIKAFDDSPFEKGPLFPCSQSKVKININLSTKTLPVPGGSYKKENNSSASFAFDSSKLKSDCSIEPRLYQDIDERILPKDGSILPPVPVQPESVALQSVEFPLVPPPVVMNQSLATLVPSVPLHVPPPPLQTSSSSSIGSVVINLNVPPPPFINVPPPAGVRFSSSQNLPQSSTASQSQQTVPRFLSRPPSSSPPRNQLCPIDTCSPSGRHSRTSPGPHSKLFHSMTSSHDEVDVVERVMTNKDKDGRSYLSRQDKERGIYGQERRRTHDKGVRVRRHRSRSNSRGRSRSRSRDSKRRRRHSRSRTPVRRSSRRNRSRSPTL